MGFEKSKFGYDTNITTEVSNHYGQREVGKGQGTTRTSGFMNELTIDLDGQVVADGIPLLAPQIPAGARIEDVFLEVSEAFDLGGTSPGIEVGTDGSEATDGVSITEAQAEAVGTYDLTAAVSGTWADGLAAVTDVAVVLSGTSPTSDALVGKARLVVRYVKM